MKSTQLRMSCSGRRTTSVDAEAGFFQIPLRHCGYIINQLPLLPCGGGRRLSGGRGSSQSQCQFHINTDYPLPERRLRPLAKGEETAEKTTEAFKNGAVQLARFLLIALLLTNWLVSPLWAKHANGDRPNIIFILADDLGYGDLGVLWQNSQRGGKKFATPNFDRMAAEGLILNQHYTGAPVCAPARGTLLSGVHQGHCTIRNTNFDDALEHNHTLGKHSAAGRICNRTDWEVRHAGSRQFAGNVVGLPHETRL